jgi:exosortase/archaeosortase family protein
MSTGPGKSVLRVSAWLGTSFLLFATIYQGVFGGLSSSLAGLLDETLGSVYPAVPFLALMILLTGSRWREFYGVLAEEGGMRSRLSTRGLGVLLALAPAAVYIAVPLPWASDPYASMELAAVSLVMVLYGALIAINPRMSGIMLPFAALFALGLVAPLVMLDVFGGPLAELSAYIAQAMTSSMGIGAAWDGTSFVVVSRAGQSIQALVTPACSAAYSISIYLSLLGLAHLDYRGGARRTLGFAAAGVLCLPMLNSARIAINMYFGYLDGPDVFWALHDWLGYLLFLGFFVGALVAYSRTKNS